MASPRSTLRLRQCALLQIREAPLANVARDFDNSCHYSRVHVYCEAESTDAMLDVKVWDKAQKQLIKMLGADSGASSIAQPFRLAGTWHLKGSPKFVRIKCLDYGRPFVAEDVLAHLPRETSAAPGEVFEELAGKPYPFPVLKERLNTACSKIRRDEKGTRWHTIRAQVSHVARYIPHGLSKDLAWEAVWKAIRSHEDPELVKECKRMVRQTFNDGIQKGRVVPPTPHAKPSQETRREGLARETCEEARLRPHHRPPGNGSLQGLEAVRQRRGTGETDRSGTAWGWSDNQSWKGKRQDGEDLQLSY